MPKRFLAKTCAFCICSVVLGILMHSDYQTWQRRGRDAYLASKAHYFDTHVATLQPTAITIAVIAVLFGFCVILYEILQFGIARIITIRDRNT
jgi:predicted negative regulator of RcsB-dependent stress response